MRAKLLVLFSIVAISITVCFGDDVDICTSCETIVRAKKADRRFLWFGSSSKATAKSRRSTDASDDNFISPGPYMTSWLDLCRCVCNLRQENSDTDLQQRIHTFLSEYNLAGREDTLLTSFRRRVLLHRCKGAVGNQPTGRMESHAQTLPALLPESMRDRPSTLSRSMPQKHTKHAQILPSLLPESMRKRPSNFSRSNPERLPHAQTLPALLPESMRTRPSPLSRSLPEVEPQALILPALLPESIRNRPSSLNPENDAGLSNQQNPNTPSQGISPTQHTEYDLVSQQYTVSPDQSTQNKLNRTRSIRKKKKQLSTQTPNQGQTDLSTPEAPRIYALLRGSVPLNYESAPQTGKIGSDETNRRTFNRSTPPSNQGTLQVFYGVPEDAHRPSRLHGKISSLLSQRIQSLIKGSRSLGDSSDSSTQPEPVSAFASGHNTAISVQRGGDASAVISNGQEKPFSYHITATTTPPSGHHAKHNHHYQAYAHEGSHPSGITIQGKNSAAAGFSDNIANAVERNNNQHSEITVQGKNSAAAAFSDTTADAAEGNNSHPSAIVVQEEHSAAAAIGDSVAVAKSSDMETSTQHPTRTEGKYFGNPMAGAGSDMSNDKGRTYNFVYDGNEDDGADDYIDEDVMYADSEVPTTAAVDNVMTVAEAYQEPKHLPMDPSPRVRVAEPDAIANSSSVPREKEEIYDWYSQVLKALSNYNLVVVTLLQNMLGGVPLAQASMPGLYHRLRLTREFNDSFLNA